MFIVLLYPTGGFCYEMAPPLRDGISDKYFSLMMELRVNNNVDNDDTNNSDYREGPPAGHFDRVGSGGRVLYSGAGH
jgi:hypothetical protein